MKRLDTISLSVGSKVVDFENKKQRVGPYVVDDSCFIPISEAIKQLKDTQITSREIEECYDFPSGKDTGKPIPVTRRANFHDITELSTAIMEDVNANTEKLEKARKKAKSDLEFKQKMDKVFNSPTPSGEKTE